MYKIVKAPDEVLLTVAKKITKIDAAIHQLVKGMTATLESATDPEGVGLAAPQIGKSLQLFIVKETPKSPVLVFINPHIVTFKDKKKATKSKREKDEDVKLEGCLSLFNVWGVVKRHESVTMTYTNLLGEQKTETFSGFLATILQHETDHLHGILFPKRVFEQNGKLYKSSKNEDGETVFDEITI